MFGHFLPLFFSIGIFLILSGCSGDSSLRPGLKKRESLPIERVVLHERLRAQDIKAIFSAINEKGSLDSLAGWVEGASQAELDFWADWLTDWVYQSAFDQDDLVQILKTRVRSKSFSWVQSKWTGQSDSWVELGEALWLRDEFPELAAQVVGLAVLDQKQNPLLGFWNFPAEVSVPAVVADLKRLAASDSWLPLQESLQEAFQDGLLPNAAHSLRKIYQETGALSLVGLHKNLHASLEITTDENGQKASTVSRALHLAALLDRPGEEVFGALQKALYENSDAVRSLAAAWDPVLTKSMAGMVRESLIAPSGDLILNKSFWLSLPRKRPTDPPTEAFQKLFAKVFSGLDRITDPRRKSEDSDAFFYLFPLHLNAWALTCWLEEVVRVNEKTLLNYEARGFEEKWWELKLESPEFIVELLQPPLRQILTAKAKLDLQSVGKADLIKRIEQLVGTEGFGGTIYTFEKSGTSEALQEGLASALQQVHSVRALSDLTPVLVVVARALSEPGTSSFLSLEELKKTDNLLDGLNAFLSSLDENRWQLFKKLLFVDLGLGNLSIEAQEGILRLFETSPKVAEWVGDVLMELGAVNALDSGPLHSARTVWNIYHRVLRGTRPDSRGSIATLMGDLGRARVFDVDHSTGVPLFGGFYSVLGSTALIQMLADWGQMKASDFRVFESSFSEAVEGDGWKYLSSSLRHLVTEHSQALANAVAAIDGGTDFTLTPAERIWIAKFVRDGSLERFRAFFLAHSSKENLAKLVHELEVLTERGSWNRILRLLGQIQNERVREVARVLIELESSGEWKSVLFLMNRMVSR